MRATGLLDTPPEPAFDRLTRLACRLTGAPIGLVSLIDVLGDRQFLKSVHGAPDTMAARRNAPLSHSFCRHVVEDDVPLVVADARIHPLVRANPAIEEFGVVAYLGVPLRAPGDVAIGSLCVVDSQPRIWRAEDIAALEDLAAQGATEIALRREAVRRDEALRQARLNAEHYRAVVESQSELICRYRADLTLTFVNPAYARFFASSEAELIGSRWIERVPLEARKAVLDGIAALRPGESSTYEHEVVLPKAGIGWQQWTYTALAGPDGRIVEYQAVGRDITQRKLLELELAAAKARLDDALASMDDGFAHYDSEDRLLFCNTRLRKLYPLVAELLVPGANVREVWREAAHRGQYKGVDAATFDVWLAQRRSNMWADGAEEVELGDGSWRQIRASRTSDGGTVLVVRDVTERHRAQRALEHAASHDPLTGLPNRAMFQRGLEQACARAERAGHHLAVMLIDLDRFKQVNDDHGHSLGDMLLVQVAACLKACVREGDLVARLGGDEFAVVAEGKDTAEFETLARRLVERLAAPARLDTVELHSGASVGFTVYPDDPSGVEDLLVHADRALYAAKAAGRATWAAYGPGMSRAGTAAAHRNASGWRPAATCV